MITLRPYQSQAIEDLRASFRAGHHSPLLVMPTGAGKTICFSYLTERLVSAGKRVVILVHRDELISQVSDTLTKFDVRHGLIAAGTLYDRRLLAHDASVFTLARRLDRVAVPDYVICDEAHHCIAGSSWGKVISYWRSVNQALRLIGVSATPERLSGEGLGEVFDDMILGPTTGELIQIGALSQYRMLSPPGHSGDFDLVKKTAGELNKAGVNEVFRSKPSIVGDAIAHYKKYLNGAPSVAFCPSIEVAEITAANFRAQGFKAVSIDGKMDKQIRRGIVEDFGRGGINVMTSCQLIDEGFDCPSIVGVIDLSPTESLARALQRWGRGLRVFPGKTNAVIIDHVGNSGKIVNGNFVPKHGLPDDPREWSLLGRDRSKKTKASASACRQCEKCFAVSPAAASKCRECGAPFPVKARELNQVEGELSEVEVQRLRVEAKRAQAAAQTLEDLIAEGQRRGFKNPRGWAQHVWDGRMKKRAGAGASA